MNHAHIKPHINACARARHSLVILIAVIAILLSLNLLVKAAMAQDFMIQHKERLNRITGWTYANPRLETAVQEFIVRREQLPPGYRIDPVVTRVIFYDRVFFDFDSTSLTPRGEEVLDSFALLLRAEPTTPELLIAGHTDSKGSEAYNFQLASQRAQAVAIQLASTGYPHEYMSVIAMGELQPFGTNATEHGRAVNRRVEFFISNDPIANERAAQLVAFDPCHRNDHPGAATGERCSVGQTMLTIEQLGPGGRLEDSGRHIDFR